ncbi:MAG TPA: cation transporter [Silvibacterium sp.]|nr:cation transporter [Silvibacterium sp.]
MVRRQFIKLAALTGTSAVASLATLDQIDRTQSERPMECRSITWQVGGFTCVTCAVGLKVMLRHQKGVTSADASYPDSTVTVEFDPRVVDESTLRSYVTGLGFTLGKEKG